MWIATLCLLAIAVWLFFNALNERRWVEAHSHDETVASDEGLLANFTALTRTATPTGDPSAPGEVIQTPLGRAVSKVQETTAMANARFQEQRAAAARGEDTVIGRTYSKVTAKNGVVRQTADRVVTGIGALEKKVGTRLEANRARKAQTVDDSSKS